MVNVYFKVFNQNGGLMLDKKIITNIEMCFITDKQLHRTFDKT